MRPRVRTYQWLLAAILVALTAFRAANPLGSSESSWLVPGAGLLGILVMLAPHSKRAFDHIVRASIVALSAAVLVAPVWQVVWLLALILLSPLLLVWFILFFIRPFDKLGPTPQQPATNASRARLTLIGIILAVTLASFMYRALVLHHLEQTSALFIGIPALLSVIVVLAARPRTPIGTICKSIAIALAISGIFLGEGFICIVMAAPLFFAVGILVGGLIDLARSKALPRADGTMSSLVILFLVPMSLEGVNERLAFPREEAIRVEREVAGSADSVRDQIARTPRLEGRLPPFLLLGFPRPTEARGDGLEPGDRRVIHFAGGEGRPGDLVFEVVESQPGRVCFRAVSDGSHIAHWLSWREARVEWEETGAERTRVVWTLSYRRELDPAWYFGPWERYAVRLSADYLIQAVAAPR